MPQLPRLPITAMLVINGLFMGSASSGCGSLSMPQQQHDDANLMADDQADDVQIVVTNSIGMKLTLISPGKFRMGAPYDEQRAADDEEPHDVSITRPFFLGICEVTQGEFLAVMKSNPSYFQKRVVRLSDTSTYPVESVEWTDAVEFCKRLSSLPEEMAHGRTYRLPTEAEWEYACRAGKQTAYTFGQGPELLPEYAWHKEQRPQPVGRKRPNDWGLYDMHGNVLEYCQDYYAPYSSEVQIDPSGPPKGENRVVRGGSFSGYDCRSAKRQKGFSGKDQLRQVGFRVAMVCPELTDNSSPSRPSWERITPGRQSLTNEHGQKLEVDEWAKHLGGLSGVAVSHGGEFGVAPYLLQSANGVVLRVPQKNCVEEFCKGIPPNRSGRIIFDSSKPLGKFQGDMLLSAAQMGGGMDLVYRIKPTGTASVLFSTQLRLTKGLAIADESPFGDGLFAINTTHDTIVVIDPSGQPNMAGSGIASHFAEDDLVATNDSAFGSCLYLTDAARGKIVRVNSKETTDFANTPAGICIAHGKGRFGDFLFVGTAEGKVLRVSSTGETTLFLADFCIPKDADIRGIDVQPTGMWLTTDAGSLYKVNITD